MPTEFAVVCVLHGNPELPAWLRDPSLNLHLVVNDPAPGAYLELPAASVYVNTLPLGFAANVNAALARVWGTGVEVAVCVNFDLELDPVALPRLVAALDGDRVALAGPVMQDFSGRPAFSVGGPPTALKEFTRAAGLRSGGAQRVVRGVLRRVPAWQGRNLGARVLEPWEYLPWTCVALRRAAWEAVGPLDERFVMYAEDLDWGRRAAAAGWQSRLVDVGPVRHAERATRDARSDEVYEQSHAALHAKWARPDLARWQTRGQRLQKVLGRFSD